MCADSISPMRENDPYDKGIISFRFGPLGTILPLEDMKIVNF